PVQQTNPATGPERPAPVEVLDAAALKRNIRGGKGRIVGELGSVRPVVTPSISAPLEEAGLQALRGNFRGLGSCGSPAQDAASLAEKRLAEHQRQLTSQDAQKKQHLVTPVVPGVTGGSGGLLSGGITLAAAAANGELQRAISQQDAFNRQLAAAQSSPVSYRVPSNSISDAVQPLCIFSDAC
ncbi:unnamed protein product, partial [Choristocarpus tenellus]